MNKSLLYFVLMIVSALTTAGEPASVDMTLRQVSEHVYFVEGVPGVATDNQGFISNGYAGARPVVAGKNTGDHKGADRAGDRESLSCRSHLRSAGV